MASGIEANAAVGDAAKKVSDELANLSDDWAAGPKKKPSRADLDAAVKELEGACAA